MLEDFSPRFLASLPSTLPQECPYPSRWGDPRNFSNDVGDPGGKTMDGIIQTEYNSWRKKKGLPPRDVRQCTEEEGDDIYWEEYWLPNCPKLPPGLDLSLFDTSVNEGTGEAIRILQYALNIPADGKWGPQTETAVSKITDVPAVVVRFTQRRAAVYHLTRNFTRFGADWERRTSQIGKASLATAMNAKGAVA